MTITICDIAENSAIDVNGDDGVNGDRGADGDSAAIETIFAEFNFRWNHR